MIWPRSSVSSGPSHAGRKAVYAATKMPVRVR